MPWPYCVSKSRDEKFGETVVLLVSQADERTESELLEVCRQVLTKYQLPKRLIKVREIPMTETGKIDRVRACEISNFKTAP
jgi:acyl-CoA synthetase (AMP-forming)/AMP-acid ligase II